MCEIGRPGREASFSFSTGQSWVAVCVGKASGGQHGQKKRMVYSSLSGLPFSLLLFFTFFFTESLSLLGSHGESNQTWALSIRYMVRTAVSRLSAVVRDFLSPLP